MYHDNFFLNNLNHKHKQLRLLQRTSIFVHNVDVILRMTTLSDKICVSILTTANF